MIRTPRLAASVAALAAGLALFAPARADGPATSFGAPVQTQSVDDPADGIAVADFDNDGDADFAVVDALTGLVKVRRNDGTGANFATEAFGMSGTAEDIAAGDIDLDGDVDLVVAARNGIWVARNQLFPTFTFGFQADSVVAPEEGQEPERVRLADYDGNGTLDVIVGGSLTAEVTGLGYVAVYLVHAAQLGAPVSGRTPSPVTALAAGDVDGDGRAEIVTGMDAQVVANSALWLWRNPGTGAVALGDTDHEPLLHAMNPRHAVLGDFTADGRADLVVSGWDNYRMGQNTAVFAMYHFVPPQGETPYELRYAVQIGHSFPTAEFEIPNSHPAILADVDGDGAPEVVAVAALENKVSVFHFGIDKTPEGAFVDLVEGDIYQFGAGSSPYWIAAADLNAQPPVGGELPGRDAKKDLIVTNLGGAQAHVLMNTTGGGGGGGGGNPAPAATDLSVTAKPFVVDAVSGFKDAGDFTFRCTLASTLPGIDVRVQSTTTPGDEGSWEEIPIHAHMTRKGATWTLAARYVPAGQRWFRTVTSADDFDDAAGDPIGPYTVHAGGPVLMAYGYYSTGGPSSTETFAGARMAIGWVVYNLSALDASNVTFRARIPKGTTLRGTPFPAGAAVTPTQVEWTIPTLAAGDSQLLAYEVDVSPSATSLVFFDEPTLRQSTKGGRDFKIPGGRQRFGIGSPLRLTWTRLGSTPPRAGDVIEYEITAENLAESGTYSTAVLRHPVARGAGVEDSQFVDAQGLTVNPPVAPPAGKTSNPSYDRDGRTMEWYLGALDPKEVVRMRLRTRARYDNAPGRTLHQIVGQVRAAPPGTTGDPLKFDRLKASTGSPDTLEVVLSPEEPAAIPVLRLDQKAIVDARGDIYDRRFGKTTTVSPGGVVTHRFLVVNDGGADAKSCYVEGNLPNNTTFVPGSVRMRAVGGNWAASSHTISTGGTLRMLLGQIAAGTKYQVEYQYRVSDRAKPKTYLTASNWVLRTEALDGVIFAGPQDLNVLVALGFVPQVSVVPNRAEVGVGDELTFFAALSNLGDRPGSSGKVTLTIPAGSRVVDDPNDPDDGLVLLDAQGAVVETFPVPAATAKSVSCDVGVVPLGEGVGAVRMTVQLQTLPTTGALVSKATFTGLTLLVGKAPSNAASDEQSCVVPAASPTTTTLSLGRFCPVAVGRGLEYTYQVTISNQGDVAARNVVARMTAPPGTEAIYLQESNEAGKLKGNTITWNVGTLAAHASVIRTFTVIVTTDDAFAVVEDSLRATADNATVLVPTPTATVIITSEHTYAPFVWPTMQQLLEYRGLGIDGVISERFSGAVQELNSSGFNGSIAGSGISLTNGTFLMPVGGGNLVAAGAGNLVAAGGLNLVAAGGGNIIAAGAGNLVTIDVPSVGLLGAAQLIEQAPGLVNQGIANLVAAGGLNLIGPDGASLIGMDGASILSQVAPVRAADLVAAGAGNLVAAGAGNLIAPGSLGNELIARTGSSFVSLTGGNMFSMGAANILGNAGGNLVAAGGLNKAPQTRRLAPANRRRPKAR